MGWLLRWSTQAVILRAAITTNRFKIEFGVGSDNPVTNGVAALPTPPGYKGCAAHTPLVTAGRRWQGVGRGVGNQ
jgi:hypothetical protein